MISVFTVKILLFHYIYQSTNISSFYVSLYTIDVTVTPFLNAYLTIDCLYFNSCVILFIWNTSFMILFFVQTNFIITGIPFIIIFYYCDISIVNL